MEKAVKSCKILAVWGARRSPWGARRSLQHQIFCFCLFPAQRASRAARCASFSGKCH
ncbi:hypothetical protein A2U01_0080227, partial [Trifolium medium]|nr:hypothetical protein [Trifolium medium]